MTGTRKEMLSTAILAAALAGERILEVYGTDFGVEYKDDDSPLTLADTRSHETISSVLGKAFRDVPILSEEGRAASFEERKNHGLFWLVDPLDGTKDFVKKNGEFTVNIALVEKERPVLGVIYIPAADTLYYAEGPGAWKAAGIRGMLSGEKTARTDAGAFFGSVSRVSQKLPLADNASRNGIVIVKSRSHAAESTQAFIDMLGERFADTSILSSGSATKLCLIAEGSADVYPRLGPTMEWDIAAGDVILEKSGGRIIALDSLSRMVYNKRVLKNPDFVAVNRRMREDRRLSSILESVLQ